MVSTTKLIETMAAYIAGCECTVTVEPNHEEAALAAIQGRSPDRNVRWVLRIAVDDLDKQRMSLPRGDFFDRNKRRVRLQAIGCLAEYIEDAATSELTTW